VTAVAFLALAGAALCLAVIAAVRMRLESSRRHAIAESMHELRGALTALRLAAVGDLSERVEALRTQIDRACAAVEDLDGHFRGISDHTREHALEVVDLGEVVRHRAEAWDGLAFARGGAVGLRWPIGPVLVHADPKRLHQALDNLIANGLDHGGGIVTLRGALADGVVRISVSDRGSGFERPLHDLPRARWDAEHGHGLAIVRRAIEMHDGRLRATSGPSGANVEVELPLVPS
jgi:signal transduction histidine kinase